MFEPALTRTRSPCSGLTSLSATSFIIASIVGWPSDPQGYGFTDTPGLTMEKGLPSAGMRRATSAPPPIPREDPPLAVETIVTGREAARRQFRGRDAVFRRAPRVQRLGHRAEVHADS